MHSDLVPFHHFGCCAYSDHTCLQRALAVTIHILSKCPDQYLRQRRLILHWPSYLLPLLITNMIWYRTTAGMKSGVLHAGLCHRGNLLGFV